jgi:hypothetical protein
MKGFLTAFIFCITFSSLKAQSPATIDVVENTIKVSSWGEETFYYGFAEGDKVILNFEEVNGKELKEIEVTETASSSSKFMDYKTKKIQDKIININSTGIYKFRFNNSSLSGRVCKFKIQRVPVSEETKNFNCTVYSRTKSDTTYATNYENYVVKVDTIITELVSEVAKVHSSLNANGNRTVLNFALPLNTISWSYYIGVDQVGQQAYEKATSELVRTSSPLISRLSGYNPLAALALGATSYLFQLQSGEDIDYWLVQGGDANLFQQGKAFRYVKKGKVINTFSQMPSYFGNLSFCLSNDNAVAAASVLVKVTAVHLKQVFGRRAIQKSEVKSRQEMYLKS